MLQSGVLPKKAPHRISAKINRTTREILTEWGRVLIWEQRDSSCASPNPRSWNKGKRTRTNA